MDRIDDAEGAQMDIWEVVRSANPWSAAIGLVTGVLSTHRFLKVRRPRLIIAGYGSAGSGGQQHVRWRLTIDNRPSFLGLRFHGESAHDVHVHLRAKGNAASYLIYWGDGEERNPRATIDPGQQQSLQIFQWSRDAKGYYVVDNAGKPIARFESRNQKFVLSFMDRLNRTTKIPFRIRFDDSNLQAEPNFQVSYPLTMAMRLNMVKFGLGRIRTALRIGY